MPESYIRSAVFDCNTNIITLEHIGDKYKNDSFKIVNTITGYNNELIKISPNEHKPRYNTSTGVYQIYSNTTNEIVSWVEIQCGCGVRFPEYESHAQFRYRADNDQCYWDCAGYKGIIYVRFIQHFRCGYQDYIYSDVISPPFNTVLSQVLKDDNPPFSYMVTYAIDPKTSCILKKIVTHVSINTKLTQNLFLSGKIKISYDCSKGFQYSNEAEAYACPPLPPRGTKLTNGRYSFTFTSKKKYQCLIGQLEKNITVNCATESQKAQCDISEFVDVTFDQDAESYCFNPIIKPVSQKGKIRYNVEFLVSNGRCEYDEETGKLLPMISHPIKDSRFDKVIDLSYGVPIRVITPLNRVLLQPGYVFIMRVTTLSDSYLCSGDYCLVECSRPIVNNSSELKSPKLEFYDNSLTITNPISNPDIVIGIDGLNIQIQPGMDFIYTYVEIPSEISYTYSLASNPDDFIGITTGVPWTSGNE